LSEQGTKTRPSGTLVCTKKGCAILKWLQNLEVFKHAAFLLGVLPMQEVSEPTQYSRYHCLLITVSGAYQRLILVDEVHDRLGDLYRWVFKFTAPPLWTIFIATYAKYLYFGPNLCVMRYMDLLCNAKCVEGIS